MDAEADTVPLLEKSPRYGKMIAVFLAAAMVVSVLTIVATNSQSIDVFSKRHRHNHNNYKRGCDKHISKKVLATEQRLKELYNTQQFAELATFYSDKGAFVKDIASIDLNVKETAHAIFQSYHDAGAVVEVLEPFCTLETKDGRIHELGTLLISGLEASPYYVEHVKENGELKFGLDVPVLDMTAPADAAPAVASNAAAEAVLAEIAEFTEDYNAGKFHKIEKFFTEDSVFVSGMSSEFMHLEEFVAMLKESYEQGVNSVTFHLAGGDGLHEDTVYASTVYKWEGGQAAVLWRWVLNDNGKWKVDFLVSNDSAEPVVEETSEH